MARPADESKARRILHGPDAASEDTRVRGHFQDELWKRAEAEGQLDQLPGKGRPLNLGGPDGLARLDDRWLANHIVANANYTPEWAAGIQEVVLLRACSQETAMRWRQAATDEERVASAAALEAAWTAENAAIRLWNSLVPSPSMQRYAMPMARRWQLLRDAAVMSPPDPRQ